VQGDEPLRGGVAGKLVAGIPLSRQRYRKLGSNLGRGGKSKLRGLGRGEKVKVMIDESVGSPCWNEKGSHEAVSVGSAYWCVARKKGYRNYLTERRWTQGVEKNLGGSSPRHHAEGSGNHQQYVHRTLRK